jgi:hypothetical protein
VRATLDADTSLNMGVGIKCNTSATQRKHCTLTLATDTPRSSSTEFSRLSKVWWLSPPLLLSLLLVFELGLLLLLLSAP